MVEDVLCSYSNSENFSSCDLGWLLNNCGLIGVAESQYDQVSFRFRITIFVGVIVDEECLQRYIEWAVWYVDVRVLFCCFIV